MLALLLLTHSSTTLSSPLCFLNRTYSAQKKKTALVGLTIQKYDTDTSTHVGMCTGIIRNSRNRNSKNRSRHRHSVSTPKKPNTFLCIFCIYSLLRHQLIAKVRQQNKWLKWFIKNPKATAAFLAVHGVWCNVLKSDSSFLESCIRRKHLFQSKTSCYLIQAFLSYCCLTNKLRSQPNNIPFS